MWQCQGITRLWESEALTYLSWGKVKYLHNVMRENQAMWQCQALTYLSWGKVKYLHNIMRENQAMWQCQALTYLSWDKVKYLHNYHEGKSSTSQARIYHSCGKVRQLYISNEAKSSTNIFLMRQSQIVTYYEAKVRIDVHLLRQCIHKKSLYGVLYLPVAAENYTILVILPYLHLQNKNLQRVDRWCICLWWG